MIETLRFPGEAEWLDALTRDFRGRVEAAIAARGTAHVALSGGSTPKPFYERLNRETLPWKKIEWWLGDERWVPPNDAQSNEKMVYATLGRGRPDFSVRFHSWHSDADPAAAARAYESLMQRRIGNPPVLDLVLLGIGPDGHTASLFPGTRAVEEACCDTVANEVPQMNSTRLTVTFPLLNRAREVWFLVSGHDKEAIITRMLAGDTSLPAARVDAAQTRLYCRLG